MSQEPRRSSRPSSVIKREELEGKLSKRKAESEIKVLQSRSKALETVRRQEIEIFEEEAKRLSELVDINFMTIVILTRLLILIKVWSGTLMIAPHLHPL